MWTNMIPLFNSLSFLNFGKQFSYLSTIFLIYPSYL